TRSRAQRYREAPLAAPPSGRAGSPRVRLSRPVDRKGGASCGSKPAERFLLERGERASLDRLPRPRGEVEQEAEVVQAEQPEAEELLLVHEVAQVRAAEARARGARAALVERTRV